MRKKTKKPISREALEERLERAAQNGGELDLDFDEITQVTDLVLERTRRVSEEARKKIHETIEDMRSITLPPEAADAK